MLWKVLVTEGGEQVLHHVISIILKTRRPRLYLQPLLGWNDCHVDEIRHGVTAYLTCVISLL